MGANPGARVYKGPQIEFVQFVVGLLSVWYEIQRKVRNTNKYNATFIIIEKFY